MAYVFYYQTTDRTALKEIGILLKESGILLLIYENKENI